MSHPTPALVAQQESLAEETFVIYYAFEEREDITAAGILPKLVDNLKHVPAYWLLSKESKAFIAEAFENVTALSKVLRVQIKRSGTASELAHYAKLFDDMAERCHKKKVIAIGMPAIKCSMALGGTKSSVAQRYRAMYPSLAPVPALARPSAQQPEPVSGQGKRATLHALPVQQPLEDLIGMATAHGLDDDPDHEVGDLRDLLRTAWALMQPEQRQALLQSEFATEMFEMHSRPNPYAGNPDDGQPRGSAQGH